jgi:hypothetical protein
MERILEVERHTEPQPASDDEERVLNLMRRRREIGVEWAELNDRFKALNAELTQINHDLAEATGLSAAQKAAEAANEGKKARACTNCGETGHNIKTCTEPCGNCGSSDHYKNDCPQPKKEK